MSLAQQPSDGLGGIDLQLPVRAENTSTQDITWQYANRKYVLPAGATTMVPYMAMVYYQGDPRSIDVPGGRLQEQYRRNEVERLRIVHGVYEHEEQWALLPTITCMPIDSDVPFNTVLRDPEGTGMTQPLTGTPDRIAFMEQQLEQQAAAMRIMQAELANQKLEDAAIKVSGGAPDLDHQVTTSKAVSPEEVGLPEMGGNHPERKDPASGAPVAKRRPEPGEGPAVVKDS